MSSPRGSLQGGTKFDLLIDRLNRLDDARLPVGSVRSILMALANCTDRAFPEGGRGLTGRSWSWLPAVALFKKLIARLDGNDRRGAIRDVFGAGAAIGWLMSELVRVEIYVRCRYADQDILTEKKMLSDVELEEAKRLLVERFKSTERGRLVDAPELLGLMYGWKEAGDEGDVLEWVQEQTRTDAGFLALLSACRGWLQTNNGTYYPLNCRDLRNFLDFDEALERLRRIAED